MASHRPTFARNSSVIQRARTGSTGSASAAGSSAPAPTVSWLSTSWLSTSAIHVLAIHVGYPGGWPSALAEALGLAPVGRHRGDLAVAIEYLILTETLGELAGLGVPQPDPVSGCQRPGRGSAHRRLDLPGALDAGQAEPGGQVRPGQPVRGPGARGHVAAGEQRGGARAGA